MMDNQRYLDHDTAIKEFKEELEECTTTDYLGRPYILTSRLLKWFKSPVPGRPDTTHAGRLLAAAYRDREEPVQPISREQLCDGDDRCFLMFSIFLQLGHGDLIHRLLRQNKADKHLPINLLDLRTTFISMHDLPHGEELAVRFDEIQWQFCAPKFELDMGREYPKNQIIPIRRRREIAKGGTAQLWQIEVLEEFVGKELREVVKGSKYDDPNDGLGPRYEFALKSFEEGNRHLFNNEKKAFRALRKQKHMVLYLGEFGHKEPRVHAKPSATLPQILEPGVELDSVKTTFNILLEYGESDLAEYFADRLPPYFQPEVEAFYQELFSVADAIQSIHDYRINENGRVQEFAGWHADIKPENILSVQGRFKLADPGFVKFVKKSGQNPEESLLGGTATYGAPERLRAHGDPKIRFSQTIDTWSLACVFSIAATWVVLGYQGIPQYSKIRRKAIEKIVNQDRSTLAGVCPPSHLTNGDYFHDGSEVLPDVLKWHNILRSALRGTDTVTSRLLDLVDQKMLIKDPKKRLTAKELCEELRSIMNQSAGEQRLSVPENIKAYLLEVDDAALSKPRDSMLAGSKATSDRSVAIVEARKERLLGLPLMKTTHRSQVLRSSYITEEPEDASSYLVSSTNPHPIGASTAARNTQNSGKQHAAPTLVDSPSSSRSPRRPKPGRRAKTEGALCKQNVWQAREELEQRERDAGLMKSTPKDKTLSRHFNDRDIKFLVDNAETMKPHWYEATYLLDTLVMKARGQDKNGMDLQFTSGQVTVDGWEGSSKMMRRFRDDKFKAAMKHSDAKPIDGNHTDLTISLGNIFHAYLSEAKRSKQFNRSPKNLTLIVFTDGIWEGMKNKDDVKSLIVTFAKELKDILGDFKKRPVSIEFVQFGDDEDASYRLWILDNHLIFEGVPDIIDTEKSGGDVYKMLLGSFIPEYDEMDSNDGDENEDDETMTLSSTHQYTHSDHFQTAQTPTRSSTQYPESTGSRIHSSSRSSKLHAESQRDRTPRSSGDFQEPSSSNARNITGLLPSMPRRTGSSRISRRTGREDEGSS